MDPRLRIARRKAATRLLRRVGPRVLRWLASSWRADVLGAEHLAAASAGGGGHFMALWHGRMIVALPHHAERGWQVLVSPSEDGDISEHLLESFGYGVLRGSTSRTGARALRAMRRTLERGDVLVVTPDGPRGPRHSMNLGLAWLARATGGAIVPCGFVCDRAWRAKSWDRFTVPKRGARLALVYGEPVRVPRDADEAALTAATELLRERMLAAERRGFEHLGVEADW
ncbi:MAG: lysophospholipid acyltransferase family protein [Planctomycetes bacterium]|nr:lysophospholipid acyltransferase family protein [Planctomycetota bacterium]